MNLYLWLLLFLCYSFLGWMIEMIYVFTRTHRIVDRGFLIGPYCPIYGFGALLSIGLLTPWMDNPFLVFILSILLFGALEYLTSYLMESMFQARWWDYSNYKYHINGRVSLVTLIPFGLLGLLVLYFIHPLFVSIVSPLSLHGITLISSGLFFILMIDVTVSIILMLQIRNVLQKKQKDVTEEASNQIRNMLYQKSILYRRIVSAFPDLKGK